jgi:hypothetical protein
MSTLFHRLTPAMRRLLVDHIAGPQPFVAENATRHTVTALMTRALLRLDQPKRRTILTQTGHAAALECCNSEAEALMALELLR